VQSPAEPTHQILGVLCDGCHDLGGSIGLGLQESGGLLGTDTADEI
jgi:hypothetical protein